MATINLGAIKFNWRGAYNNATAYAVDDVVSSGGSSYICILASTGNAVSNGTYWQQMSAAGTNGTNGTNGDTFGLANKEIAFKTNAGALDGIPIGTAGQALKVNSGATGYEFGSAGTSELLGSGESSAVSSLAINNSVLSSAYEEFVIYTFISKVGSGGSGNREMFVSTDNGSSTMNVDRLYHFAQLYPNNGTGHSVSSASTNADRIHLNAGGAIGDFHNGKITILRPSFASAGERNRNTILSEAVSSQNPGGSVNVENLTAFACIHDGNGNRMSNIDYVRFEMNGATFDIKWAVYGRKW